MIRCALPPVRRAVPLSRGDPARGKAALRRHFGGRDVVLYESGTAALASALAEIREHCGDENSQVILPAYGCPDLVAACLFAGVRPRLVDVAKDGWGYDTARLAESLVPETIAIVAVNLLGLGDDAEGLLPLAHGADVFLVQDSAQCLPREAGLSWPGDYVVLSFGRGKPLNLLHGGALVVPLSHGNGHLASGGRRALRQMLLSSRIAGIAFNIITQPAVYWWVSKLPNLQLGETRYHAVKGAAQLPNCSWGKLDAAFEEYLQQPSYNAEVWAAAVTRWEEYGVRVFSGLGCAAVNNELLRLPLLAPSRETRDRLVRKLNCDGLGASSMYGAALNYLPDIPAEVRRQGPFPNANSLAARLFTLPAYVGLSRNCIARSDECIRHLLSGNIGPTASTASL